MSLTLYANKIHSLPVGFIERRRAGGGGRVDGSLAVSRGLGDFRFKARMDLSQQEQKVTCNPDIIIRERSPDDGEYLQ